MTMLSRPPRRRRTPSRRGTAQVPVPDGYVAVAEAARQLGISHGTLIYRILRGQVATTTVMIPATLITDETLQLLRDEQEHEDDERA